MTLMIYGANGYTGRLIAAAAARRGLTPLLAGRTRHAVEALAAELQLESRVFDLDDAAALAANLGAVRVVLNCAGPFSRTAAPMLQACLQNGVHYLDITGEIEVFAMCHQAHERARDAGVVVLPGAGFDVVPTDCVAALLKQRLTDATHLVLAFEAGGGPSPGTAKTSIEGLAHGGRARIGGRMRRVPLAWKSRTFLRDGIARSAMTIPWGDVYTAYVSTGIADIETYMAVSPATIRRVRRLRVVQPLLRLRFVQRLLQQRIGRATPGPSAKRRQSSDCHVWGEASNARGMRRALELRTPNGYDLTVDAALGIAASVLQRKGQPGGYFTPSQLMGAEYVLSLPGVQLIETDAAAGAVAAT